MADTQQGGLTYVEVNIKLYKYQTWSSSSQSLFLSNRRVNNCNISQLTDEEKAVLRECRINSVYFRGKLIHCKLKLLLIR